MTNRLLTSLVAAAFVALLAFGSPVLARGGGGFGGGGHGGFGGGAISVAEHAHGHGRRSFWRSVVRRRPLRGRANGACGLCTASFSPRGLGFRSFLDRLDLSPESRGRNPRSLFLLLLQLAALRLRFPAFRLAQVFLRFSAALRLSGSSACSRKGPVDPTGGLRMMPGHRGRDDARIVTLPGRSLVADIAAGTQASSAAFIAG
jgi:hypothetical protein